jgi:hypothetical protein
MTAQLLPHRFLFRFAVPCLAREPLWSAHGPGLEEKYRLINLAELEPVAAPADFRAAWSPTGLAFSVQVRGKRQPPWCRGSRPEDSDGVRLWIDTRDVHNVHRAGRFCHGFLFLPTGAGSRLASAMAQGLPINRAREQPRPIRDGLLQVQAEKRADGYALQAFIPAEALTGFDPQEHPRLGFNYAIIDRELGVETFSAGPPLPYDEDPSLWATLEMVRQ